MATLIIAVDTGGTFTDAVGRRGEEVIVSKVPSTPDDPSRAVQVAVDDIVAQFDGQRPDVLIHGTTVATNALLEQRGAETWLVTNAGFEDLLTIGRQARPSLYALEPEAAPVLIARHRVIGVPGRIAADGSELTPLDTTALDNALAELDGSPRAWAVCLLHAYANPAHERAVAERLRTIRPDDALSLSSEILPVFREVERASTTVANAFVQPLMQRYLRKLKPLADRVSVMGSSGGRLTVDAAEERPAATALSGPAGGVVAAIHVARERGLDGVIAFDMGGTSTDVSLCRDTLPLRFSSSVGAFPIHLPMLDIHTVGAGGGSVAYVDGGGALRVGPQSAGAFPGPACYALTPDGQTPHATVTDANVVLGRLPADTLLGGKHPIDAALAHQAVRRVGDALGVSTERAAAGILAIAIETMARAIRTVSVERGDDPRDLTLCCFGGAGGLHACDLADALDMRAVIVPPHAGLFSAVGMLRGASTAERSQTILGMAEDKIPGVVRTLSTAAEQALGESVQTRHIHIDGRYVGQSFELTVPWEADSPEQRKEAFEVLHEARFGHRADAAIEWVNVRVRVESASPESIAIAEPSTETNVMGPTTLRSYASTTWVAEGWRARLSADGTITMARV